MENIDKMLEEIQHKINVLEGHKAAIVQDFVFFNESTLFGEVLDLLTRTNITKGDYYAPDRKYSIVDGFKNLRVAKRDGSDVVIDIKVNSKKGEYAAKFWAAQKPIVIADYKVKFCYSYAKAYYE